MLLRVFSGFTMGIGLPRAIMGFNLIGVALKLPLNWIFMFGALERFGGPPPLGGPGCAVATALISGLSCVLAWSWCAFAADFRQYRVFADFSPPRASLILGLLKLGLPIGATFFVDVTAFTFMALFIARLGPVASAAHQIAANLAALAFMLPLALGNAAGILAGHALGAGDARRARRIALIGLVTGVAEGMLLSLTLWFGAGTIAGLYVANGEVRRLATTLIGYVAVYHLFDALQAVAVNVLRGYRKSAVPMAIYALALWGVGLGGGYVLGLTDQVAAPAGVRGFWLAAAASLALAGGLVTGYLLRVARAAEITAADVRKVAA
jgi:MATE family multidrug resistance protein